MSDLDRLDAIEKNLAWIEMADKEWLVKLARRGLGGTCCAVYAMKIAEERNALQAKLDEAAMPLCKCGNVALYHAGGRYVCKRCAP